ncbi:alpha/beta hydrolase [Candidatus Poseidoniales archaeon]|nr:alpha/beta hydrolase [Candidatus Poseidoniales archaeon]MDG1542620.1 alpha/beta hydrolase [Candidatus Thalassarchaeaceae archaeon]
MKVLWAHGLEGSPNGSKPKWIKENLGWDVISIDMSKRGWTIGDQTAVVLDKISEIDDFDLIMGSSYGGLAVANAAKELLDKNLKLVLMAPAFGLAENFQKIGEEELDEWENNGFRPYFHHGLNEEIKLGWDFMVSARKMSWPNINHPTVIIHGVSDDIVPIESSRKIAESNSNVELIEVEDGHRLVNSLQFIPIAAEQLLSKK